MSPELIVSCTTLVLVVVNIAYQHIAKKQRDKQIRLKEDEHE